MNDTVRARLTLRSASAETVRDARLRLERLGFRVVDEGPAGIGFTGDAERFEEVFGAPREAPVVIPEELADVAAAIVFPRGPELFP
jgi:hypothetical protein